MLHSMTQESRNFAREIAGEAGAGRFEADEDNPLSERLERLAGLSGRPVEALRRVLGRRLLERFGRLHPEVAPTSGSALDFLEQFERRLHDRLSPGPVDAPRPRLCCVRVSSTRLLVRHGPDAALAELFELMTEAALARFGARAEISRRPGASGGDAIFEIRILDAA